MFEDGIIALGSKLGIQGTPWKLLGYVWVWMWFAYSVPGWVDPMFTAGMAKLGSDVNLLRRAWRVFKE
jgi:hypothetical protein